MTTATYASRVAPAVLFLRAHRKRKRLSINALSDLSGVARSTIYRLEEDTDARRIDMRTLGELARVLDIDPGRLFSPPKNWPNEPGDE